MSSDDKLENLIFLARLLKISGLWAEMGVPARQYGRPSKIQASRDVSQAWLAHSMPENPPLIRVNQPSSLYESFLLLS